MTIHDLHGRCKSRVPERFSHWKRRDGPDSVVARFNPKPELPMKQAWIKTTLALAIGALSSQAMANGLAINEHSASSMGTSFAGRSSNVLDASTVAANPAGMSKLERREVSGGLAFIHALTDIDLKAGNGSTDGDMVPCSTVPFGYFATPINDKLHFGLGLYVPFAVASDYESGHAGRAFGVTSEVEVVNLQPTISYKINDQVSVGAGLVISRIYGKLTSVPTPGAEVDIEGDDIAYGYNLGVLVDINEQLSWGLNYKSQVKYALEGDTKISGINAGLDGKYDAGVDISMPESIDTSVTYRLDDQWTLYGGATWTRWSRLDALVVENADIPFPFNGVTGYPNFETVEEELKWKDTWSFAVGASYQLNPQWVLRAGLALDESPTNDQHRTTRIPVSDRTILSFGAGWNINQDMTLDLAYSYLMEDKG